VSIHKQLSLTNSAVIRFFHAGCLLLVPPQGNRKRRRLSPLLPATAIAPPRISAPEVPCNRTSDQSRLLGTAFCYPTASTRLRQSPRQAQTLLTYSFKAIPNLSPARSAPDSRTPFGFFVLPHRADRCPKPVAGSLSGILSSPPDFRSPSGPLDPSRS
jgi:hypothetical protein